MASSVVERVNVADRGTQISVGYALSCVTALVANAGRRTDRRAVARGVPGEIGGRCRSGNPDQSGGGSATQKLYQTSLHLSLPSRHPTGSPGLPRFLQFPCQLLEIGATRS